MANVLYGMRGTVRISGWTRAGSLPLPFQSPTTTNRQVERMKRRDLGARLVRVFATQVLVVSVALSAGIYITNHIVQDSLMLRALQSEAQHFWTLYDENPLQPLPNTSNMRGFIAIDGDETAIPDVLRRYGDGYIDRVSYGNDTPTLHVSDHANARLYLLFASAEVSELAFYFGIVPLTISLVVIYGLSFLGYLWSQRAISPIVRLANYFERFKFDGEQNPKTDLRELKQGADAEVETMIGAIDRFSDRLHAFVERERTFTRDASHELRTPIAVFKGSLDLFERSSDRSKSDIEALQRMRRTLDDMEGLLETLLLLAREDQLNPPTQPILANELISRSVQQLQTIADQSGNQIRYNEDAELRVCASERVIQMIVTNLVRNAINYTEEGLIEVTVGDQRLQVRDTGMGMNTTELENAFEPFYRSEAGRAMSSGHGLGLSIVRRLAAQFEWTISAHSTVGEGTTIEIRFFDVNAGSAASTS